MERVARSTGESSTRTDASILGSQSGVARRVVDPGCAGQTAQRLSKRPDR